MFAYFGLCITTEAKIFSRSIIVENILLILKFPIIFMQYVEKMTITSRLYQRLPARVNVCRIAGHNQHTTTCFYSITRNSRTQSGIFLLLGRNGRVAFSLCTRIKGTGKAQVFFIDVFLEFETLDYLLSYSCGLRMVHVFTLLTSRLCMWGNVISNSISCSMIKAKKKKKIRIK